MTPYKGKSLRIPAEIFPVHLTIRERDVLGMPECVLCVQFRMRQYDIARVLKGIFSCKGESLRADITALQKDILGNKRAIMQRDIAALPAEFGRIDARLFNFHAAALAHRLDPPKRTPSDRQIAVIPKRRTAGIRHFAVFKRRRPNMPQRIPQCKKAVLRKDIPAFLECRLAVLRAFETAVL